jgi:hypothetical protein
MPSIREDQLATWTKPAFGNEEERAVYTENTIRAAVNAHPLIRTLPTRVFAKGSYKNNTNVRRDSDVDVAVEYTGIIYPTYDDSADSAAVDRAQGLTPYSGPFLTASGDSDMQQFKNAVGEALIGAFGTSAVTRHNKVFTVRETTRSLAADVIPCATHRHYWGPRSLAEGIRLLPDRPAVPVDNFPQQHYDNGVAKNLVAARRYKRVVRILKSLENRMVADGAHSAVPGYLLECLVYQAPLQCFAAASWAQRVRDVLAHLWTATEDAASESQMLEVNEVKLLFHPTQKWTRDEARSFVHAAWQYVKDS